MWELVTISKKYGCIGVPQSFCDVGKEPTQSTDAANHRSDVSVFARSIFSLTRLTNQVLTASQSSAHVCLRQPTIAGGNARRPG
jgi:hypothetical protein